MADFLWGKTGAASPLVRKRPRGSSITGRSYLSAIPFDKDTKRVYPEEYESSKRQRIRPNSN